MTRLLTIALTVSLSALLLSACASQPAEPESPAEPAPAIDVEPEVAERAIPADSVYPLLMAEFALRRRDYDTALEAYLQQSGQLGDVGVSQHTTHLAQFVGKDALTLKAVEQWLKLAPQDLEANNTAAILLAGQRRPLEALPHMTELARGGVQANFPLLLQGFNQLPAAQQSKLVEELNILSLEFPQDPALLMTQALLNAEFKQYPEALEKLRALFAVEPQQHQALLLEARILIAQEAKKPFSHIQKVLKIKPEDSRLRLEYARLLTNVDLSEARHQFEILSNETPGDTQLLLSLAVINRELGDDVAARVNLQNILQQQDRHDEAHYYLGRIAEDMGEHQEAVNEYRQVGDSRQYLSATQRLSHLLVAAGMLEENGQWFNLQRQRLPSRSEQLYNIEADVLSLAGQLQDSQAVLTEAIARYPESAPLRYTRSLVSEQQGDIDLMERDLRAILEADPGNSTALNALGYTLANLTQRYDEAHWLISQALELAPDEPAILDSMGWVLYRQGDYKEAIVYLTRAYASFPDPEVASHLGEVLWVSGDTQAALDIWQDALLKSPDSEILLETLQRLGIEGLNTPPLGRPNTETQPQ